MRQVSESKFSSVVTVLRKSEDFKNFILKIQKRVDAFLKEPVFSYPEKNDKGESVNIKFNINDASGFRKAKYKKILISISNIDRLMFILPSEFKKYIKTIQILELSEDDIIDKYFSYKIQSLLMYSDLRSGSEKLLYSFYGALEIKTCVYCNSQHTILLKDTEKTMRLQADHFIAKSKFPTFSITLANLYPTCNNCNHLKNDKDIFYILFYDDSTERHHDLGFKIEPISLTQYYLNRSSNNAEGYLSIEFKDYYDNDIKKSSKLNSVLKIDKIYENHKDIVADLINKKVIYNDTYLKNLAETFKNLYERKDGNINMHLFNQMLYGHSLEDNDINKRVFSKLTIDIKKQLDSFDFKNIKVEK